jgi:hypothetical protein
MRVIMMISGIFLILLGVIFITGSMLKTVGIITEYLPFLNDFAF